MSTMTDKIIDLIHTTPGLLEIEIAEQLEIDLPDVKDILTRLIRNDKIFTQKKMVGALEFNTYQPTVLSRPPDDQQVVKSSKRMLALEYLARKSNVLTEELSTAMGIDQQRQHPGQYLRKELDTGVVVLKNKRWSVMPLAAKTVPMQVKKEKKLPPPKEKPTEVPHIGGVVEDQIHRIDIVKSSLIKEEFSGYLKGTVIDMALHQDFAQCQVFAGILANLKQA